MTPGRIVSLGIGLVGLLAVVLSLLPIGLGMLGLLGVVADVSYAENRQIGFGFLAFGLPPFLVGVLMLAAGAFGFFLLGRKKEIPNSPNVASEPVPGSPRRGDGNANGSA